MTLRAHALFDRFDASGYLESAGEFGSSMIFMSVVAAALDPCCSRAIDCEKAARRASR